jgi:hypothetical protein
LTVFPPETPVFTVFGGKRNAKNVLNRKGIYISEKA